MNYFEKLNAINVNGKTEQKNGLTYLSWAFAWGELKKMFPDSFYTVYETANGMNYFTDGHTCWVKTGVTVVDGEKKLECIEYLPVMDFKNKSIPTENVTSFDVNKAIQRSLTKAIARHGLGLYIYAGEDLPEEEKNQAEKNALEVKVKAIRSKCEGAKVPETFVCELYNIPNLEAMSDKQHSNIIANWDKLVDRWKQKQN